MFRSEFLGLYIENASFVHLATEKALASIAEAFGSTRKGSSLSRRVTVAKKRIRITHTQYARSPHFRAAVLSAYRQQCAMCGLQLDLVEAAHIVPHAHAEGSDTVGNGLALCALHHNSFDKGLTFVDKDFSVQINEDRVEYLGTLCTSPWHSIIARKRLVERGEEMEQPTFLDAQKKRKTRREK